MPKYYGIQRSDEYLAHYGVKGMRWGVRRAIERGNVKALDRHYRKAREELARRNALANVNTVNKVREQNKKEAIPAMLGAAAIGGGGTYLINPHLPTGARLKTAAALAGTSALATGASYGLAGLRARHLASKKGHAKAVAKRNEFAKEMKAAFKGTKYRKLPNQIRAKDYENYLLSPDGYNVRYSTYEALQNQRKKNMRRIRG